MTDRIVREKERRDLTGLGRTTAWKLEKKGLFPARVGLIGGRVGWKLSQIQKWIRSRQPVERAGAAA